MGDFLFEKSIKPSQWGELADIRFQICNWNGRTGTLININTFDIETSSGYLLAGKAYPFDHEQYARDDDYRDNYDSAEKVSLLYIWAHAIEDGDNVKVFIGRTWSDYRRFLGQLSDEVLRQAIYGFETDPILRSYQNESIKRIYNGKKKPYIGSIIYIHNLGFEFQHMRNIFNKDFASGKGKRTATFARSARKPLKTRATVSNLRVTLKDSLALTQKSLDNWCKDDNLPSAKLQVPEGYYEEIRTPETPLTDFEIQYSVNDVASMVYGIKKYADKFEGLGNIPMTQTGIVRRIFKEDVSKQNRDWAELCRSMNASSSIEMFRLMTKAFGGGWVHANAAYAGVLLHDVKCFDFASAYPFCMTSFKYPVGPLEEVSPSEFDVRFRDHDPRSLDIEEHYVVCMRARNVHTKTMNTYWSASKCDVLTGQVLDNGRIFQCDEMAAVMTDLDFAVFQRAYEAEITIERLFVCKADFLAPEFVVSILKRYEEKTTLKGVPGAESRYLEAKQFANSAYGVAVTRIISDNITFRTDGWVKRKLDEELFMEAIIEQSKDDMQFIAYLMGVFVTAFNRANLWELILKMDSRVVYGDTDSLKGLFNDEDMETIAQYNAWVLERHRAVSSKLNFNPGLYSPKTPKGKEKPLGVFDREEDAVEFKTLGAKRYVCSVQTDKGLEIKATVAGLPKKRAAAKLKQVDDFKPGLVWSTRESGKKIAHYNDNQSPCVWVDRDGRPYKSSDKYGVAILPTTFNLEYSKEYEDFLALMQGAVDTNELIEVSDFLLIVDSE